MFDAAITTACTAAIGGGRPSIVRGMLQGAVAARWSAADRSGDHDIPYSPHDQLWRTRPSCDIPETQGTHGQYFCANLLFCIV